MAAVEMTSEKKVCIFTALSKPKVDQDIKEMEEIEAIFDFSSRKSLLYFELDTKISSQEDTKRKEYCKYHDLWSYNIDNYWKLKNLIQKKINKGV